MKKADHENIVSNLNAEHNKQMREMRIKHTRDVHKLQQELKDAIALIKERENKWEKTMARHEERLENARKENVVSQKELITTVSETVKEVHEKMVEVGEKHKREISELQEKLVLVAMSYLLSSQKL